MKRELVVVEKGWSSIVETRESIGDNVEGNRGKVGIDVEWPG